MDNSEINFASSIFQCIDHTTLTDSDSHSSVEQFCRRAMEMKLADGEHVASVCVYPRYVGVAKRVLENSGIKVASVAGAFPHGQLPIELKCQEVEYAINNGADEVDIVINRGALLSGEDNLVLDEVCAMRRSAKNKTLKVIIESGELPTPHLIALATEIAIKGGADFVKTSTGKSHIGATLSAAEVMLNTINENVKICKKNIGFKVSGGVKTVQDALAYAELAKKIMGGEYIDSKTFRVGTSSLTEKMYSILTF